MGSSPWLAMKLLKPSIFVGLALAGAWFLLLRPVSLGGPASFEVVSGTSMEPTLHTGDLVISRTESRYNAGDIVIFRVPEGQQGAGSLIVHRIIGGEADIGFMTQGDNRNAPDAWHPTTADVIGRSWVVLPGAGNFLVLLRQPLVLATLLGGLAAMWFLTWGGESQASRKAQPAIAPRTRNRAR